MDSREAPRACSLTQGLLQYRGMLYGFIYALVRDVIAAEEIFQEVAVVAMEKERRGDEIIREPALWLKGVVRRIVQAGYRTHYGRLITVDPEYLEQVAQGFETEAGNEHQNNKLMALGNCLEHVSQKNRDLLRRRYVLGSSYQEIGKVVNRTPGALRVLVHRIQRQLADCVTNRLGHAEC